MPQQVPFGPKKIGRRGGGSLDALERSQEGTASL